MGFLGGCGTKASESECKDAPVNDHFRFDPYSSDLEAPPHGIRTPGTFSNWGPGEVVFERKGGAPYGFFLVLEGEAAIPDLLNTPLPTHPAVTAFGFAPPVASPTEPLLRFGGSSGELRLLAGNAELEEAIDGWTVRSPRDESTCEAFQADSGWVRAKPVYVERDGEQVQLLPGETAVLGEFEVSIVSAQSNNRNHPWAPCSDWDCPWEKLAWWIAPLDADLITATNEVDPAESW